MNNYSDYRNYYMLNGQNNLMNQGQPNQPQMNQGTPMVKPNQPAPGVFSNPNFNKCNYDQQDIKPASLYEPYQGFIRGNMFPDLYNTYKVTKPYEVEPMNEQAQILTYVDALQFAAHDLNLYLDNHPEDREMIQLFNQYREESNRAIKDYEKKFGPLFDFSDSLNTTPWAWNQLPWPWENR